MNNATAIKTIAAFNMVFGWKAAGLGARWQNGVVQVEVEDGPAQRLVIGDGEGQAWYWSSADGVQFRPTNGIVAEEDSAGLSVGRK